MRILCTTLASYFLLFLPIVRAENWPSWRGPDQNGISQEAKVPLEWSTEKNLLWKYPMPGRGGSTPVLWGDRLFLTSGEGEAQVLLCLSTEGKLLWKKVVGTGGRVTIKGDEANEASASPSTDGKHVYVFVGTGQLACYDFDGNEKWKTNIQDRYGKFVIIHGLHTTPLLHGDRLYLSLLHSKAQLVVALDKTNGKEIWKHERKSDAEGESREAYSSPVLWDDGKQQAIVILGSDYATGHRLEDGSEIWRLGDLNPKAKYSTALRTIATPLASRDLLIVPTARGGLIAAVKPGAQGFIKAETQHEQWRRQKGAPDVPSPLLFNGLLYLCRENGLLHVWDAKTGQELYSERLHPDRYRSSPVAVGGRIYCTSRDGTFSIVEAGPKFKLLAVNNLPDYFTASPVIANGRIYLRGFTHLYAVGEK